jgi:hypothetical protein
MHCTRTILCAFAFMLAYEVIMLKRFRDENYCYKYRFFRLLLIIMLSYTVAVESEEEFRVCCTLYSKYVVLANSEGENTAPIYFC